MWIPAVRVGAVVVACSKRPDARHIIQRKQGHRWNQYQCCEHDHPLHSIRVRHGQEPTNKRVRHRHRSDNQHAIHI